jgi:hypothetical protein
MFRPILAAALVLLLAGDAGAQFGASVGGEADMGHGPGDCERYAAQALAAAQRAQELNCGFPPTLRYSTNTSEGVGIDHLTYCQSHTRDEVQEESGKRARQMNNCEFCRQATTDIVNDAQEARHLSCGFGGGRWREDTEGLYQECFASRQNAFGDALARVTAFVNGERQARRASLFECRRQLGEEQIAKCNAYADGVMKQVGFNRMMRCGDTPASASTNSRWSADREFHFRWCTGNARNNPDEAAKLMKSEEAARDGVNQLCKARMSTDPLIAVCEGFAKKAVEQATYNAEQKCGGTGSRWSKDFDFHYAWCIENTWTNRNDITAWRTGEDNARDDANSWCPVSKMVKKPRPEMLGARTPIGPGPGKSNPMKPGTAGTSMAKNADEPAKRLKPRTGTTTRTATGTAGAYTSKNGPSPSGAGGASRVMSPGLLDGHAGFARQGPAAAGTPIQAPAPPRGDGLSVR